MTKNTPVTTKKTATVMEGFVDYIIKAVNNVDETAIIEHVEKLKAARPHASPEQLVQILIRQKCLQAGAVGAVTSSASIIPGLGTVTTLTFGVAADVGLTLRMQSELVLEIAAVHNVTMSWAEKRRVIILVSGLSASTDRLLNKSGVILAEKATEQLAEKAILKAIPF
ncbi:MAG: hypothetical protein AAF485_25270, partial [Chloroflexota bacterium]